MSIPKLTLVTHKNNTPVHEYLEFITRCAQAGITAVQLREKHLPYDSLKTFGKQLKTLLDAFSIPLIVNDNVDLAIEIEADGVHLGQTDGSAMTARSRLGEEKLIGLSIDSLANLHEANQLPIDYVGVGSIFETQSKSNVATIWGINGLKELAMISKHPIIAIGGINEFNVMDVIQSGALGIAVIGAIHNAINPELIIQKLLGNLQGIFQYDD